MTAWARILPLALSVAVGALSAPAHAAPPATSAITAPAAAAPSTSDLQALAQTLQDPARRAALLSQVNGLIALQQHGQGAAPAPAPETPGDAVVGSLASSARKLGTALSALSVVAPVRTAAAWAEHTARDPASRDAFLLWLATVAGVVAVAALAERLAQVILRRPRRRLAPRPGRSHLGALAALFADAVARLLPAAAFLVVGFLALSVALAIRNPGGGAGSGSMALDARALVVAILYAHTIVRAVTALVELMLAHGAAEPGNPHEESFDYWLVWLVRLVRLAAYSFFLLRFWRQMGLDPATYAIAVKALGLLVVGLLIMLILQSRATVGRLIRGRARAPQPRAIQGVRARVAAHWHVAAILYVVAAYVVWVIGVAGGPAFVLRASVLTVVILVCTRFALMAASGLAGRLLAVSPILGTALPGLQARTMRYASVLVGILRGAIALLAALLLLQAWGLDPFGWLSTDAGQRVTVAVLAIGVTLATAFVAWEVVSLAIESYLQRQGADGTRVERSARMRTLLPLLRKTVATVLAITVGMVVLAELGVNIAPLLAGAGIAGIAVGFGAQTLVKDIITGLFILMQDAVAVGDVVTLAGSTGRVEQVSIRSIRLRDLGGTVILIPFSEVTTVQNLTKDFSYAMFDIGVAYREDIDEVIAVLRALAAEMAAEEDYAWRILDPIEILGLDKFADSAVMIKARIKTRPVQQWTVMREFNRRMKRRFDELDIEIPFPHQTIYFGTDKQGHAPPAHVETARPRKAAGMPAALPAAEPARQHTDEVAQPS